MKYLKLKQIARLSFFGENAVEQNGDAPFSVLTFNLADLTQIPLSDKAFLSLESCTFHDAQHYIIRCRKLASQLIYWDSAQGCRGAPILFTNVAQNFNTTFYNTDTTHLYKFPIDKNFFNNPQIKFEFDVAIPDDISKNVFSISVIVYDEEDEHTESNIEVGNDDWKTGKKFGMIY